MEFTTRLELHSQTTRLLESTPQCARSSLVQTGLSPSLTRYSNRHTQGPTRMLLLETTTRTLKGPDFKVELFPLHSPLLGESLLVSFPPLIDMLKFRG